MILSLKGSGGRVVRTPPSIADRDLIDAMAAEGVAVTASQLERWRHRGLLPTAVIVREGFGGSSVAAHHESVTDACRDLAGLSTRGRPWQLTAADMFELGHDLSTSALRGAALYQLNRATLPMKRAWARVEAGTHLPAEGDDEVIADIATLAGRSLSRGDRRLVAEEIRLVHDVRPEDGWSVAIERALIWRTADIVVPWRLAPEQRNLARHGVPEPMDPFGLFVPLPSERSSCVATLSWAEANLAREWLREVNRGMLDVMSALTACTWIVTTWRLEEDPERPDLPLPQAGLTSRLKHIVDARREAADVEDAPEDLGHA